MADEYVVMTATLSCDKGTAPSKLVVLPDRTVFLNDKFWANKMDCTPYVHVFPFAMCTSKANPLVIANKGAPVPCTPTCSTWNPCKTDHKICGIKALMKSDTAFCPLGAGTIKIDDSGQTGGKTAPDPPRVKELKHIDPTEIVKWEPKEESPIAGVDVPADPKPEIVKEKTCVRVLRLAVVEGIIKSSDNTISLSSPTNTEATPSKPPTNDDQIHIVEDDQPGKAVYGPYYEEAIRRYKEKPDWYPNPDESSIVQGDELKEMREEYEAMVKRGELPRGHHRQGLAFGGENEASNIQHTGETRVKLSTLAKTEYDAYIANGGNPDNKWVNSYEDSSGRIIHTPNPNHTEVTVFQNEVLRWQRSVGLRS